MSQENATNSLSHPSVQEDATTDPTGSSNSDASGTQATFELLLRLLDITKGDLDQAEKLAQLIARLSPASPLSLLTPSASGHNCHGCGPSTKTSVGTNTAAAAAASTTGVAVATSVPFSSATATAVAPSLLTVGSTTSTTAVPFSDLTSIPSGITVNISANGLIATDGATGSTNTQQANTALAKQTNVASEQQTQTVLPRVQFQNTPSQTQEQSKPQQPPSINTSTSGKDFPWQPHQYTFDQQQQQQQQPPAQHQPDEAEVATLNELGDSPIHKARIVNIQKRPSPGSRSPTVESFRQGLASSAMKPFSAANIARQRPMSLGANDNYMNRFLTSEAAQRVFDKFSYTPTPENEAEVPQQPHRQPQTQLQPQPQLHPTSQEHQLKQHHQQFPLHSLFPSTLGEAKPPPQREDQQQQTRDNEDLESENAELKEEITRLTQQCRAWERIASLSVNLASVEGDSKRASLVSSIGVGGGGVGAGFV